jgi:hypothetical protein
VSFYGGIKIPVARNTSFGAGYKFATGKEFRLIKSRARLEQNIPLSQRAEINLSLGGVRQNLKMTTENRKTGISEISSKQNSIETGIGYTYRLSKNLSISQKVGYSLRGANRFTREVSPHELTASLGLRYDVGAKPFAEKPYKQKSSSSDFDWNSFNKKTNQKQPKYKEPKMPKMEKTKEPKFKPQKPQKEAKKIQTKVPGRHSQIPCPSSQLNK